MIVNSNIVHVRLDLLRERGGEARAFGLSTLLAGIRRTVSDTVLAIAGRTLVGKMAHSRRSNAPATIPGPADDV